MQEDAKKTGRQRNINEILKGISASRKIPKSFYALLLVLYAISSFYLITNSRSDAVIELFGNPVPVTIFTGVFSSFGNICVILMVVMFRKLGFFTAVFLLLSQFPVQLLAFFVGKSYNSIPGLFTNVVSMIAVGVIYANNRRIIKYQETMREIAVTDPLTGLPNRYACTVLMDTLIKRKITFTLVSVNLNNFKTINDTLGHKAGDEMLREIANRWRILADSGETGTYDFVARLGSDEYSLIIRAYQNEDDILKTIAMYEQELERKIMINNCEFFMTACFGVAEYPTDAPDSGALYSCADAALHEVKRQGGSNKVLRFNAKLLKTERYLAIERRLRVVLEKDEIEPYFQPQYDMSHNLVGFEALARVRDEDGKFISPMEFIPVAENAGLIDKIDNSILRKSAKFLEEFNKNGNRNIKISSNISVLHLMKNDFMNDIMEALAGIKVSPSDFKLEITESVMIDSDEKALERIDAVKDLGMQVAIDDFGTGYSSLSYLHKFPADMLKIDKSFIDVMNTNEASKKYIAMIISIGHVLKLQVISEGVETQDQIDTLREIGCDYIQGYIWGKPKPYDEALKVY
ncbi:MAG: bifunctional diguanylate cyclase/phosphodiesterase [Lachnospiraceae bacterium]|nr:bifunctional diguanylate cyclase/phosphodiesterase [Lachnospiraceae bacterium]